MSNKSLKNDRPEDEFSYIGKYISEVISTQMAPIKKVIETQQKVFTDALQYAQAPIIAIQKALSRYIYIQPWVFEFLLKSKVGESKYENDVSVDSLIANEEYIVYTRIQLSNKVSNPSIKISQNHLDALKELLQDVPQMLVNHTGQIILYEEIPKLQINGFDLPLKWDERFSIAKFMFSSEEGTSMPWMISDVVKAMGEDEIYSKDKHYDWLYEKIRQFSLAIEEKIGYEDFFAMADGGITLSPQYLFLIEKTHRFTQDE